MDENAKREIENMIDVRVARAMEFETRKRGDTPTDANQLTPKQYVDSKGVFAGYVDSAGDEGSPFPTNWTSQKDATGQYKITHNLGSSAYAVGTIADDTTAFLVLTGKMDNEFQIWTYDSSSTLANRGFYFLLAKP